MTETVSVVIPTRNRREMLDRTIACVLGQDGVDIEVLVVDDGSTDDTHEYLTSIADSRVSMLHGGGRGAAHARNTGIAEASGAWIAFVDDDDLWAPGKLAAQRARALESAADVVFSGGVIVDPGLRPIEVLETRSLATFETDLAEYCAVPAGASNVMARAALVQRCGGFDERLSAFADWDLWIRFVRAGGVFASLADPQVGYLHHGGAMSAGDVPKMRRELERLQEKHGQWAAVVADGRIGGERFWRWYEESARRACDRREAARVLGYRALRFRSPSDLVRAGVMAVAGEPGMARLARLRQSVASPRPAPRSPDWLDALRAGRWPPPVPVNR
ncbi:MAG: glycosyltransferase family 2 protein [Miltoncostaeaceae bacterium]